MIAITFRACVAVIALGLVACGTPTAPPTVAPRTSPSVVDAAGTPAGDQRVVFDLEAAERFFTWIDGRAQGSLDWKEQRVSGLVREWAKGNALGNPDEEIARQLEEVARAGALDPRVVGARRLLTEVDRRKGEFLATVPAHLEAFLPRGTSIRARIAPSVFVPTFAFSDGDNVVISLTSRYWKEDPGKILNLLVHEIFHNGFAEHQRGDALADVDSKQGALGNIEWQSAEAAHLGRRREAARVLRRRRAHGTADQRGSRPGRARRDDLCWAQGVHRRLRGNVTRRHAEAPRP